MVRILDKTYSVISKLQVEDEIKLNYKSKALKYYKECGCSLGGIFSILTIIACIFYWIFIDYSILIFLKSFLLILIMAFIGKLLGVLIARFKLFVLYLVLRSK